MPGTDVLQVVTRVTVLSFHDGLREASHDEIQRLLRFGFNVRRFGNKVMFEGEEAFNQKSRIANVLNCSDETFELFKPGDTTRQAYLEEFNRD